MPFEVGISERGQINYHIEVVVFEFSLFNDNAFVIDSGNDREEFMLIDAGVVHNSSKRLLKII